MFGKPLSKDEERCCKECTTIYDDDETTEVISFENFLHNVVYIKKDTESTTTTSSTSRDRRDTTEATVAATIAGRYSAQANRIDAIGSGGDPFTEGLTAIEASSTTTSTTSTPLPTSLSTSPVTSTAASTITSDPGLASSSALTPPPAQPVDNSFNVTVPATGRLYESMVIGNLSYFYSYDVKIIACHDPVKPSGSKLCSASTTSQINIQTFSRGEFEATLSD